MYVGLLFMKVQPLIDLHEDVSTYYILGPGGQGFPITDFGLDTPKRHADVPKLKRGNARVIFASIFPMIPTVNARVSSELSKGYKTFYNPSSPRGSTSLVFEHIKVYYALVDSFPRNLMLVRDRQDLRESMKGTRTGFLLSLEGTEALDDTDDIRILYNCGLRNLGFNWNYDTRYSASCMSKKDYGLTGEGETLLEEMNKLGIIAESRSREQDDLYGRIR